MKHQSQGQQYNGVLPTILETNTFYSWMRCGTAYQNIFVKILKTIKLKKNSHALSVSTGNGFWDYISFKHEKYIANITATDIVKCPVNKKDQYMLQTMGNWKYTQVKADKQLPFSENKFDLIYHYDVLEHVNKPFLFLSEQYRVLKKGGTIIVGTPNLLRIMNILRIIVGKLDFPQYHATWDVVGDYFHTFEFAEWHLKILMEEIGFKDIKMHYVFFGIPFKNIQFSAFPKYRIFQLLCHFLVVEGKK
ncbi:MAG: methyltransferase domain-containing protein [Candidatus Roizmanbacteria bacterium]